MISFLNQVSFKNIVDNYVKYPNRPQDLLINVYIPENATKNSPIMFYVNNGWLVFNEDGSYTYDID